MFRWAKKLIRRWMTSILADDGESNELIISHPTNGRKIRVTAIYIAGQMLVCDHKPTADRYCVPVHRADNEVQFWAIWRRLGGDRLRWPDGTPFQPNS